VVGGCSGVCGGLGGGVDEHLERLSLGLGEGGVVAIQPRFTR
jgi:hypothetical protein